MQVLELFSGTKSFSKIAEANGHETFAVDYSDEFSPDYLINILNIDYEKLPNKVDIIWASPPCTCFSVASIGKNWIKDDLGYHAKRKEAIEAVKIVEKMLEIISYYESKNKVMWYFENPRGILRKLPVVIKIYKNTVTYCQYGYDRMKPTDIWTNDKRWSPHAACKNGDSCHISAPRGSQTGTQGRSLAEKWSIPPLLCQEILCSAVTNFTDELNWKDI